MNKIKAVIKSNLTDKKTEKPTNKLDKNKRTVKSSNLILNKIYNSDCLKLMEKMPGNYVDLVLISPPYDDMRAYEGNAKIDIKAIALQLFRVIKKGGVVV